MTEKLLTLGGHFDGTYQTYDSVLGPILVIPWIDRIPWYATGHTVPDSSPVHYERYRVAEVFTVKQTYKVFIHDSVPRDDQIRWILQALMNGYNRHKHCDSIYEETGHDCRRSD